jgi:hypothetical protein
MKQLPEAFLVVFLSLLLTCCEKISEKQNTGLRLWYKQPATTWEEALPVGNGRIGAMVFGDPVHYDGKEQTLTLKPGEQRSLNL